MIGDLRCSCSATSGVFRFFPWKNVLVSYTIRKMAKFNREQSGRYVFVYRGEPVDTGELVAGIRKPARRFPGGRGAPGIFELGGRMVVCRQYLHGGWLRGITGEMFLSQGRALRELEVTAYLEEKGFPVVSPVGYVVERQASSRKLYFLSLLLPDARDLMTYFASAGRKERLRMSKRLAADLFEMGRLGVYHPDLHLRNVLVAPMGELFFLDFDKAYHKEVGSNDYERMFWRLDRFVRKYAPLFGRAIDDSERLIFLRTYERLSGDRIMNRMAQKRHKMEQTSKLGWTIDRFLYGRKKT